MIDILFRPLQQSLFFSEYDCYWNSGQEELVTRGTRHNNWRSDFEENEDNMHISVSVIPSSPKMKIKACFVFFINF